MNFLQSMLSEDTIKELNEKLGEELLKQVNEKIGDYKIDFGKEKMIPKAVFDADRDKLKTQLSERDEQLKKLVKDADDNMVLQAKIKEMQTANETAKAEYVFFFATTLCFPEQSYGLQSGKKSLCVRESGYDDTAD